MITKFQDLINRAIIIEDEHTHLSGETRKKERTDPRPVIHIHVRPQGPPPRHASTNQNPTAPTCGKRGGKHLTKDCLRGTGACFNCGKGGHHRANCPYPPKPTVLPAQQAQLMNPASKKGGGV